MIVCRAVSSANSICQAAFGPYVLKETRAKTAAEYLVHNREGIVIGVVAFRSQSDHTDVALVHIAFLHEVNARLGPRKLLFRLLNRCALRQSLEGRAQRLLHGR